MLLGMRAWMGRSVQRPWSRLGRFFTGRGSTRLEPVLRAGNSTSPHRGLRAGLVGLRRFPSACVCRRLCTGLTGARSRLLRRRHRRIGDLRPHHGLRRNCGRGRRRGRGRVRRLSPRDRGRPWLQQKRRIDVALVVSGDAYPEIDERLRQVDDAARPYGPDDRAFSDRVAPLHADRSEVHERRRVAGRRLDRDRLSPGRNRAGERDGARDGRAHRTSRGRADVETTVLSACVRVRAVERERPQHLAVDRPGPRVRDWNR